MEKKYLTMPTSSEPTNLTPDMHGNSISCYLFVFSSIYKNIVTLGELAKRTSGELYYYPDDDAEKRNRKFFNEFKNCVTRDTSWEGVFRLRASAGWKISQIYGNYSKRRTDLLSTSTIDDSKALIYEFELEDEVARTEILYLQGALLYTNSNGQRRIRVINYAVPLSDNLSDVYERIDAQALGVTLLRMSFKQLEMGQEIALIRNDLLLKAENIVKGLCTACKSLITDGHTELLASFRQCIQSLLKHMIFSPNLNIPSKIIDSCNALRLKLNFLNIDDTLMHFTPYLISLHTMVEENVGYYEEDIYFMFPQSLELASASLREDGLYLMDDGEELHLLIGPKVQSQLLKNLFGTEQLDGIDKLTEDHLNFNHNDILAVRISLVIRELQNRRAEKFALMNIIKQGDNTKEEKHFFEKLVEKKLDYLN